MIFPPDLVRRIESSAARVSAAVAESLAAGGGPDDPARAATFDDGALVAFGPGRYVNRAIGISLDDLDDARLDELEEFFAAAQQPPSLEVASWAPPALIERLARRGYALDWFRNIYVCQIDDLAVHAHPAMNVATVDEPSVDQWLTVLRGGHGQLTAPAAAVSDDYGRALFHLDAATHFLADLDGRFVGCGSLVRDDRIGWLGAAGTLPAYRQRGVQGALVRHRVAAARAAGCDLAVASAIPSGASSRNLARLGFTLAYCQVVLTRQRP